MEKVIGYGFAFFVMLAMVYLFGSFVAYDFNTANWGGVLRAITGGFMFICIGRMITMLGEPE